MRRRAWLANTHHYFITHASLQHTYTFITGTKAVWGRGLRCYSSLCYWEDYALLYVRQASCGMASPFLSTFLRIPTLYPHALHKHTVCHSGEHMQLVTYCHALWLHTSKEQEQREVYPQSSSWLHSAVTVSGITDQFRAVSRTCKQFLPLVFTSHGPLTACMNSGQSQCRTYLLGSKTQYNITVGLLLWTRTYMHTNTPTQTHPHSPALDDHGE